MSKYEFKSTVRGNNFELSSSLCDIILF